MKEGSREAGAAGSILRLRRVALVLVAGLLAGLAALADAAPTKTEETQPVAYGGRIVGDDQRLRLVLDFDRPVRHRLRFSGAPRRMVVALPRTTFKLPERFADPATSLVSAVRFAGASADGSRLAFDLAAPVTIARESFVTLGPKRHRLVVDLRRADDRSFAALVRRTTALTAPRAGENRTAFTRRRTIVLDPGHGGIDGGAKGRGRTVEKTVTLAFAFQLRDALQAAGPFDVALTREKDVFVPLSRRLAFTRQRRADLMISIHADSLRQRSIRGATVYTLNSEGSDAMARGLADRQNRADLLAGIKTPKLDRATGDILFDLMHRETRAFSGRFAQLAVRHLKRATRMISNPHRSADFYVLKAPEVPSVLLELGYLSNRKDEKLMASEQWREKTATAMAEAVVAYFTDLERIRSARR